MKHLLYFFALLLPSIAADFYVSKNGSDAWSGKIPEKREPMGHSRL